MSLSSSEQKLTVVISDIHGCGYTLVRLLNKCPKGSNLIFSGDLIDRGPHSRKVVEFAMDNNIPTVMGNHEDLCLAFHKRKAHCAGEYERDIWLSNGGDDTIPNWPTIDGRGRPPYEVERDKFYGGRVPDHVLDWMENLPPYLTPSDELDSNGLKLLVSHTGYGIDVQDEKDNWFRTLWGRFGSLTGPWFVENPDNGDPVDDGYFRTIGHTSYKQPVVTEKYALIDTGAPYKKRGAGNLTAFIWPTKEVISQPYDENLINPTYKITNGCISS